MTSPLFLPSGNGKGPKEASKWRNMNRRFTKVNPDLRMVAIAMRAKFSTRRMKSFNFNERQLSEARGQVSLAYCARVTAGIVRYLRTPNPDGSPRTLRVGLLNEAPDVEVWESHSIVPHIPELEEEIAPEQVGPMLALILPLMVDFALVDREVITPEPNHSTRRVAEYSVPRGLRKAWAPLRRAIAAASKRYGKLKGK